MSVVTAFRGETALSAFRINKLLQKAQTLGLPEHAVASEYWYFVASDAPLSDADALQLKALLAAERVTPPDATQSLF